MKISAEILRTVISNISILVTISLKCTISNALETFVMLYQLTKNLNSAISNLVYQVSNIGKSTLVFSDINMLLHFDEEEPISDNILFLKSCQQKLEFIHVSYKYPQATTASLTNVDIAFSNNEKVLIVGQNGSGKTTFINLLLGLLNPTKGNILYNSYSIYTNIKNYREHLTCQFQRFNEYHMSLSKNIFLNGAVKNVCQLPPVNRLVEKLEKGMNTSLGQETGEGVELSGGEWQLIALERALQNEKAEIIVLDEPYSHMDQYKENEINSFLFSALSQKMLFVISHNLKFAPYFDRIIVFENATIVEDGNHIDLLNKNSYYAQLYNAYKKAL